MIMPPSYLDLFVATVLAFLRQKLESLEILRGGFGSRGGSHQRIESLQGTNELFSSIKRSNHILLFHDLESRIRIVHLREK